jgi:hypothetical protein
MIPVALPLDQIVPPPELFAFRSRLHGQKHVARVMVHAFRLIEATSKRHESVRLWAAVYIHDLERRHDGICRIHGGRAVERLHSTPSLAEFLARGGVRDEDVAMIETAVARHCVPTELRRDHPHWPLTALIKDADALDRVRISDLDPSFLRHREAVGMVGFAERLYEETDELFEEGPDYFSRLWPEALRLMDENCPT